MAYKVIISELANYDLDQILDYMIYKLDNQDAAKHFANEVEKKFEVLVNHPNIYALSNNVYLHGKNYRKFVINNFVMLYRVNDDIEEVFILRFFYGRQDYSKYI